VRSVPQYRFYATSLLFLYDGAEQDEIDALDEESGIKYSPDVRVKIVDFAHAITDLHAPDTIDAPFPPSHPKRPDQGYLKGLCNLKVYFKRYYLNSCYLNSRIWKEVRGDEDIFEGAGDLSLRTRSSVTAPYPFSRVDPFHTEIKSWSAMNEVAVVDEKEENEEAAEQEEDCNWSDVSV
jgi:hypothetical protein